MPRSAPRVNSTVAACTPLLLRTPLMFMGGEFGASLSFSCDSTAACTSVMSKRSRKSYPAMSTRIYIAIKHGYLRLIAQVGRRRRGSRISDLLRASLAAAQTVISPQEKRPLPTDLLAPNEAANGVRSLDPQSPPFVSSITHLPSIGHLISNGMLYSSEVGLSVAPDLIFGLCPFLTPTRPHSNDDFPLNTSSNARCSTLHPHPSRPGGVDKNERSMKQKSPIKRSFERLASGQT